MSKRSKPEFRKGQQGHRRGSQQESVYREQASSVPTTFVTLQAEADKLRKQVERSEGGAASLPRWERLAWCYRRLYEAAQAEHRGVEEHCDSLFLLGTCLNEWADALGRALPGPGVPPNATHLATELCRESVALLDGLIARLQATPVASGQPASAPTSASSRNLGGPSQSATPPAPTSAGPSLADVAANCGNALATWAELASPSGSKGGDVAAAWQQSAHLFREANARYEASLVVAPDDAQVLGNCADCLVKRGEALRMLAQHTGALPSVAMGPAGSDQGVAGAGDVNKEVDALCALGVQTYLRALACAGQNQGTSDDEDDDVPGLLYNFGVSLYTAAQVAELAPQKSQLLQESERRLRHAASFNPLDPLPRNALGDVLVAQGELAHATAHAMVADASRGGGGSAAPMAWPQTGGPPAASLLGSGEGQLAGGGGAAAIGVHEQAGEVISRAYTILQAAVTDGYQQALRVSRHDVDAQVGMAEVWAVMGRCRRRDGDAAGAHADFVRALQAYVTLVGGLHGPGTAHGKVRADDWADLLYNCACVAAIVGDVAEGGVAAWALGQLAAQMPAQALVADAWASDEDLASCHAQPWFQALVAG